MVKHLLVLFFKKHKIKKKNKKQKTNHIEKRVNQGYQYQANYDPMNYKLSGGFLNW